MKVYRISRWMFLGICLLILALPVSRHWRLLAGGESTTATLGSYTLTARETPGGNRVLEHASELFYEVNRKTYRGFGPANYEYAPGREVRIRYDPDDPQRYVVLTFSGLYLSGYSALPLVILILWGAFYLSFNRYYKRSRSREVRLR